MCLSKDKYTHESTVYGYCDVGEGGSFECPMHPSIVQAFGDYVKLVKVIDDPPRKA